MNLKPIVFVKGKYGYASQNTTQQLMLLKAMKITSDPKKLKELIGVKTVAEVYRTLDKMAMRKEYHAALADKGITFDYLVGGIKKEIDDTDGKAKDRLAALGMLLKSIGLDKYEESSLAGGSWEDALLKLSTEKADKTKPIMDTDYEVVQPVMPESVRIAKEKEKQDGRSLYE